MATNIATTNQTAKKSTRGRTPRLEWMAKGARKTAGEPFPRENPIIQAISSSTSQSYRTPEHFIVDKLHAKVSIREVVKFSNIPYKIKIQKSRVQGESFHDIQFRISFGVYQGRDPASAEVSYGELVVL